MVLYINIFISAKDQGFIYSVTQQIFDFFFMQAKLVFNRKYVELKQDSAVMVAL